MELEEDIVSLSVIGGTTITDGTATAVPLLKMVQQKFVLRCTMFRVHSVKSCQQFLFVTLNDCQGKWKLASSFYLL